MWVLKQEIEPQRRGERRVGAESFALTEVQLDEIIAFAREALPCECCGVIGGSANKAQAVYPMRNVAANPQTMYEAAPEDLFAAQKTMRGRGESLIAIYHSHPNSEKAAPSETDVRLAFYPQAIYLIVALDVEMKPDVRGFRLYEREGGWEEVELKVSRHEQAVKN